MKFYPKVAKLFIIFLHTGVFNFLAWWGKNSINFAFRNLVMQFLSEVRQSSGNLIHDQCLIHVYVRYESVVSHQQATFAGSEE